MVLVFCQRGQPRAYNLVLFCTSRLLRAREEAMFLSLCFCDHVLTVLHHRNESQGMMLNDSPIKVVADQMSRDGTRVWVTGISSEAGWQEVKVSPSDLPTYLPTWPS